MILLNPLSAKETVYQPVRLHTQLLKQLSGSLVTVVFLPDNIGETEWATSKPEC